MKFTIIAKGTHSVEWPVIEVFVNGKSVGATEVKELGEINFDIALDQEQNNIRIHYSNK